MNRHLPAAARALVAARRALLSVVLGNRTLTALVGARHRRPRDGRTLDAQLAALMTLEELDPDADLSRHDPASARLTLAAQAASVDGPGRTGVVTEDHTADGPRGPIPLRLYSPPGVPTPSPALVYFHGGGWVCGSIETHDALCQRLADDVRCRVVSVGYRLAPEHRFPAGVEDALAAFRWVVSHAGELGIDASRVAVAGDSAGGNLAAVVARKARGDARSPALQVLLYPGLDGTCSQPSHTELRDGFILKEHVIQWFLGHYLERGERAHPDMAILLEPDIGGVAPALIYTAGFDPLRDEGRVYGERLRAAGVQARHLELPSLVHGFAQMTGTIAAAERAMAEITADVRRELSG